MGLTSPPLAESSYTASVGETTEGFRQRARFEAGRYGSDPWVFVRELLQNARDAGAGEVWFRVETVDGRERIVCRDDGEGMTLDHARRFLFTLYASSKLGDADAAGRFGIGFWSVLRFDPSLIIVRSRPADEDGWEVSIDGGFRSVRQRTLVMQKGTEVVLERSATGDDSAARVAAAVRADTRGLTRRDHPSDPVTILVNDEVIDTDRQLASPNLTVEEPGFHVAVALEESPRVDVFAHGLRVRTTSFLDELLLSETSDGPAAVELPDGLLPRVVLDSDRLEVLMARGDTREDATMRRLVRRAEQEVGLLVGEELDLIAPRPRVMRWIERIGHAVGGTRRALGIAVLLAAAAATTAAGIWWMGTQGQGQAAGIAQGEVAGPESYPEAVAQPDPSRPYRDLAASYGGPSIDGLADAPRVQLSYRPEDAEPLFTALRIGALGPDGSPRLDPLPRDPAPYRGLSCSDGCLEVELRFAAGPGLMRVPVASGHRIDPGTVLLDDRPAVLSVTNAGEPVIRLEAPGSGVLHYLSGPAPALNPDSAPAWPDLPRPVIDSTQALEDVTPAARVTAATDLVRTLVSYDRSAEAASRLEEALLSSGDVFAAFLEVGAGDCDVQNAVLAAVLDRSGVPAWLAVGMVGSEGRARPGLHAWVEYLQDGWWHVADASAAWQLFQEKPAEPVVAAIEPDERTSDANPPDRSPAVAGTGLPRTVPLWALVVVLATLLGAAAALYLRWRRSLRRVVVSDGTTDLARLLRGALLRPRAYRGVGALFSRPLVPLVTGRRISLPSAVERARAGRLFRGTAESEPVRFAVRRGEAVIDVDHAEGAAVADLLGARDLEAWDGVADRAQENPATDAAEAALRRLGIRWKIRIVDDPPEPVAVIESHLLGLGGRSRVAVVDASGALWAAASRDLADSPARAAFVLADGVAGALDLRPDRRRRWLTALAREAVVESSRGGAA